MDRPDFQSVHYFLIDLWQYLYYNNTEISKAYALCLICHSKGVIVMSNASEFMSKQVVNRGEIYYIVPDGDALDGIMNGGRPAIIVSNDMNNQCNGVVEVVYLSRHPYNDVPTNVRIYSTGSKCWAICGQIQTVAKRRIGRFVNQLDDKEMENVNRAMALGLDAKLNMSTRDVQGLLDKWRIEMQGKPDEKVLTDAMPYELDDVHETAVEPPESVVSENKNSDAPVQKIQKSSTAEPVTSVSTPVFDVKSDVEYIRVCAERDVYRNMYQSLLNGLMQTKSIAAV